MKKYILIILLIVAGLVGVLNSLLAVPSTASVQVTFATTTATHATLTVPIQWQLTVVNTGDKETYTKIVNLIAPDGTSFQLVNATFGLKVGQTNQTTKDLTTSTLTPQTGAFQLTSQILLGTTVVYSQTIPVTITPTPSSGVYVSVGDMTTVNAIFGMPTQYKTV